ncbi:cell division protein FtsA [Kamptonema cortianum]|nr:cell division protein FtsA [Geitlerinema splendidum]MDK3158828.1 cell division protein FtsA [Kamptonema cortianum]
MEAREWITVLDIGTSKIAAVAARVNDRAQLDVVSMAYAPSEGVAKGMVQDPEAASVVISGVIEKIERHLKRPIGSVWMNLSGPHLESHRGEAFAPIYPAARTLRPQDVHQVVVNSRKLILPDEYEQVFAVPIEYVLDGKEGVKKPVGLAASRIDVHTHIVVALTGEVEMAEEAVKLAGKKVLGVAPSSLASGLGVLSPEGMDLGAVVVDIGAGKTDVAIFLDGSYVYQGVVPIGSDHVTSDIQHLLRTTFEEADMLKMEHGHCSPDATNHDIINVRQLDHDELRPMQRRVLAEIIQARMREIFEHVGKSIAKSGLGLDVPKMAALTGGGSIIPGTEELFEKTLTHFKCRVAQPRVTGRFAEQVANPTMATAVGLARYALDSDEFELAPVSGTSGWKDTIRLIISRFDGKG